MIRYNVRDGYSITFHFGAFAMRGGAAGVASLCLAVLVAPEPAYPQNQTAPPEQQVPAPAATEPPAEGSATNNAGGSAQAVPPNGQATGAQLPPVVIITKPSPSQKPKQVVHKTSAGKAASQSKQPPHVGQPAAGGTPATTAAQALAAKSEAFNQARANLLTQIGTNSYDFTQQAIQTLPQGGNTPVDRVLLQAPGVTQDSAASGLLHVRNEHANVQYRINGIVLPDGVSGFGQVLAEQFHQVASRS